ncbi:ABC transporter ATP-binding protein [Sciscionella sediminilitoris]|uniref:ABC transporter ATP-binding protein n=1 Tax=Sciscionella sediminilitoris TaxID=1445613 RepID=UPI0004DECEEE|nr:ABC transporter ATP-binding protein [Sciscionella sp. SE31]
MHIELDSVTVPAILHELSLHAGEGEIVGLVGPNGSGKSTTLRCAYRALRPATGTVLLGGDELESLHPKESARRLAALTQESSVTHDFTVTEIVAMGRIPHQKPFARETGEDERHCAEALRTVRAEHLADRGFQTLSGGERQRVLIARALAQRPRVLVLDEPTNHLDVRHQLEVLDTVRATGVTVLLALHDLNLAAHYCDRLYVLRSGALAASGTPAEVLRPELIAEIFGVRVDLVDHPRTGAPQLLYSTIEENP